MSNSLIWRTKVLAAQNALARFAPAASSHRAWPGARGRSTSAGNEQWILAASYRALGLTGCCHLPPSLEGSASQQGLHRDAVGSFGEHECRERLAQRMWCDLFFHTGGGQCGFKKFSDTASGQLSSLFAGE